MEKNIHNTIQSNKNRTVKFGPSFCGKTYFLLNRRKLIPLEDLQKSIHIIARSAEQYIDVELDKHIYKQSYMQRNFTTSEEAHDLETHKYCCVVFMICLILVSKGPIFY